MNRRVCLLIILLSIILFVECVGKISGKVADVNTGFAEGTGKISGKVIDENTGKALPGAPVLIIGRNKGTAANTNGLYTISNIPPGNYSVQARMFRHEWVTVNDVIVAADSTTTINFQLSPAKFKKGGVKLGSKRETIIKDLSVSAIPAFVPAGAEFAMISRDSEFKGNFNIESLIELAENSKGKDTFGYRAEFLNLIARVKVLLS